MRRVPKFGLDRTLVPRSASWPILFLALAFASAAAAPVESEGPPPDAKAPASEAGTEIEALVNRLDHANFAERERADDALRRLGRRALATLSQAKEKGSAERRFRVRRLLDRIADDDLKAACSELASAPDDARIDVDQGMFLISRIVDPRVEWAPMALELDRLTAMVADRLELAVSPSGTDPRVATEVIVDVVFRVEGYTVVFDDDPAISSLAQVFETKRGYPIIIAHLMISIAHKLGIPLVGLGVGGPYILKYDGERAPAGYPPEDLYIEPAAAGRISTLAEFVTSNEERGVATHLDSIKPFSNRSALTRMLRNLEGDFDTQSDARGLARAVRFRAMLEAGATDRQEDPLLR